MTSFFEKLRGTAGEAADQNTSEQAADIAKMIPGKEFGDGAPRGLLLLHTTTTAPEADILRMALAEAGFTIEHVPTASTGIFGTMGNNNIYVREEDFPLAQEFLVEYLADGGAEED